MGEQSKDLVVLKKILTLTYYLIRSLFFVLATTLGIVVCKAIGLGMVVIGLSVGIRMHVLTFYISFQQFYITRLILAKVTASLSAASHAIGEAPDSICPKGWRMVGNEGEKSWIRLFANYYGGTHTDSDFTGTNIDTYLLSNTFFFIHSGFYAWYIGNSLYTSHGGLWSIYTDGFSSSNLYFESTRLFYQNRNQKGFGFLLHCVAKLFSIWATTTTSMLPQLVLEQVPSSAKLLILYVQKDGEW